MYNLNCYKMYILGIPRCTIDTCVSRFNDYQHRYALPRPSHARSYKLLSVSMYTFDDGNDDRKIKKSKKNEFYYPSLS